jgi:hypothetical protein
MKLRHDYEIQVSDAQVLQGIRKRLLKSIEAVDQATEIATGLQNLHLRLYHGGMVSTRECDRLTLSFNRFQNHRRVLLALADFQLGVTKLVSATITQSSNLRFFCPGLRNTRTPKPSSHVRFGKQSKSTHDRNKQGQHSYARDICGDAGRLTFYASPHLCRAHLHARKPNGGTSFGILAT